MRHNHGGLKKKVRELDKAISGLQQHTGQLLSIMNRPGWTTPIEVSLVYAQVEALREYVVATDDSYSRLIAAAGKIGHK